ncbi:MAG: MlaE family ABC transporter permease [Thermodesulfobacteriota bacterium]
MLHAQWRLLAFSLGSALRLVGRRRATFSVFLKQIYFTAYEAIPIVSWIALILGLIVVTQALSILPRLGGEGLIGEMLVWVVVRELGPVIASVIVIARSGTAIAAELGTMKISREIAALEVMGIDPMHYLVMPRVIGTAVSVFALTVYFEVISIGGGYLLAGFGKKVAFSVYMSSILGAMGFVEVGVSILKSILFGLITGTVCSYHGLMVQRSITQIPQEVTKAVIGSLGLVFVTDAAITILFFM